MTPDITVIIPTHNPRKDYLEATLGALQSQTLAQDLWELIVVDNASSPPLTTHAPIDWHRGASIVEEPQLGLTRARLAGFSRMRGEVAVLVDDDNMLAADYLEQVRLVAREMSFIGAWGGAIRPRYENPELAPPESLHALLTLRSVGAPCWSNDRAHNDSTPWGAGLCVRAKVAREYARQLDDNPMRVSLDLSGKRLLYGGDTDIAYTACSMGLGKAVLPSLHLEHLIPASRCTQEYLCRVAEGRGYSEVLHHLAVGGKPRTESALQRLNAAIRRWRLKGVEAAVERAHQRGRDLAAREFGQRG